jgi:hypothetical protein
VEVCLALIFAYFLSRKSQIIKNTILVDSENLAHQNNKYPSSPYFSIQIPS